MSQGPVVLRRYDYYLGPQSIGEMWRATNGALKMRCVVSTHRLGWELRLTVNGDQRRSDVCRSQPDVFDRADAWQKEAALKGWTPEVIP